MSTAVRSTLSASNSKNTPHGIYLWYQALVTVVSSYRAALRARRALLRPGQVKEEKAVCA
jgi:hypothetical protein